GADFTAKGDLAKHRIHCGLSADLASVTRIPRIFIPPETPFPEIAGGLEIGADILGDPREKLSFDARVTCDNLVVSGGPVENGVIGPLDLNLSEKGEMDMGKGELTRHSGEFRIQEKSGARWTGAVSGLIPPPDADEQHIDIKLNLTSEIDPAEILQILAPLAPPDAPLPEAAGVIEIAVDLVGDPRQKISFETRVAGRKLVVSGGPVGNGVIGPLEVRFSEKGEMNAGKGELSEHSGEFRIQEKSGFRWRGVASGFIREPGATGTDLNISLNLTGEIDPPEILRLLAPLTPPDLTLPHVAGTLRVGVDISGNPMEKIS
ncbi:MAG: hypothetical protein GY859_40000, partial [Desulfobacterales bacterium]|nr:hypothetical protein [Desulfobacterales bacterium]